MCHINVNSQRLFDVCHLVGNGCAHCPAAMGAFNTIVFYHGGFYTILRFFLNWFYEALSGFVGENCVILVRKTRKTLKKPHYKQ
jgi:hypothetical protein